MMNGIEGKGYHRYWGKARKLESGEWDYHLLPYHCLDVAAVGASLMERIGLVKNIEQRLSCPYSDVTSLISLLCAIHDIGKFSCAFQNQYPDLVKMLQGVTFNAAYQEKHWSIGHRFFRENADRIFCGEKEEILDFLDSWFAASAGHHGRPPMQAIGMMPIDKQFPRVVADHAIAFVSDLNDLFGNSCDLKGYFKSEQTMRELSWQVAGLVVLADWIGSNTRWFPYQNHQQSLKEYWETSALPHAEKAIRESGILPLLASGNQSFKQLFTHIQQTTPLQMLTEKLPISNATNLYIIEEITGSGKTEAALMLAHRLISAGHSDGIYFGLPTMATANAMHERVAQMYRKLYRDERDPSLILAHSASRQHLALESDQNGSDSTEETAAGESQAWLFDNRKKAMLAHVGVGTIDQALLAVLPARHQSLRLLGLHRKILIVDEVHAYDSYMNKLLCRLLKFHSAQGGSAILLSATLPLAMRGEFLAAFAEGKALRFDPSRKLSSKYPLVTGISGMDFIEKPVQSPVSFRREVSVTPTFDEDAIVQRIKIAIKDGKNICWVRNTVLDAQKAFDRLSHEITAENVILFHARFTLGDRLLIEQKIKDYFGKDSGPDSRRSKLVIATQVVEQSLDIDFDCMITDLAPIDLVIQRAGRLCRHARDTQGNRIEGVDKRDTPELIVYMPRIDGAIRADWYESVFRKAAGVYEHHGQLYLTARWLLENGRFRMPQDARAMMESVYGEPAQGSIPEAFERKENRADG